MAKPRIRTGARSGKEPAVQHPAANPQANKTVRINVYTDHYQKLVWNSTFPEDARMQDVKKRMWTKFLGEKYASEQDGAVTTDDHLALYHLVSA